MRRHHSLAAVARALDKSPGWVARQVHAGRLPAAKLGRTYRIADDDLAAFLEAHRLRPRPEAPSPALRAAVDRHRHEAARRKCEALGL